MTDSTKHSNPKDLIGSTKPSLSAIPCPVLYEVGAGMTEGTKYGRHNYRVVGVRASVYYDAAMRHIMDYWEGEDIDPDSGLPHLSKAICCLVILRDAAINNKLADDRPPCAKKGWMKQAQLNTDAVLKNIEGRVKPPYTEKNLDLGDSVEEPTFKVGARVRVNSHCILYGYIGATGVLHKQYDAADSNTSWIVKIDDEGGRPSILETSLNLLPGNDS